MSFASSIVSRGFSLLILFLPLVTGTTDSIPFKSLLIIVCSNVFKQSGNKLFLMGTFCYFQQISIEMYENSRQGLKPTEWRNTAVSSGLCGNVLLLVAWRSSRGGKGGWRGLTPHSKPISKSNPGSSGTALLENPHGRDICYRGNTSAVAKLVIPQGFSNSVQSLSRVQLSVTPWTAARQASLSITNSWGLLKLTSIESVMPSNHLILCRPLLLLPSVFPSIRISSNESALCIRWSVLDFQLQHQ